MRASRVLIFFFAFAALVLMSSKVVAQGTTPADPESERRGTVFPGRAPATDPADPSEEQLKRWNDPTLTPLERVDRAIQARAKSGADRIPNCRFGPVERRISDERLQQLFQEFEKLPGEKSWRLLQAEPDDPNSPPVNIIIPAETGPNCPERDIDEVLLEERQEILNEQTAARAIEPPATAPTDPRGPIWVLWQGSDRPELARIEAIIRMRSAQGLTRLPDCYYGPVQLRIPPARMHALVDEAKDRSGDDAWHLLLAEPQAPQAEPLTYLVRAGTKPDCPAGDIDERLSREQQRLRDEQPAP
jgi:hypothetical protein